MLQTHHWVHTLPVESIPDLQNVCPASTELLRQHRCLVFLAKWGDLHTLILTKDVEQPHAQNENFVSLPYAVRQDDIQDAREFQSWRSNRDCSLIPSQIKPRNHPFATAPREQPTGEPPPSFAHQDLCPHWLYFVLRGREKNVHSGRFVKGSCDGYAECECRRKTTWGGDTCPENTLKMSGGSLAVRKLHWGAGLGVAPFCAHGKLPTSPVKDALWPAAICETNLTALSDMCAKAQVSLPR